ncbi:MAG: 23S rRNA (adenine(2503)-C(2))-methyltransferase RlmN, partial [Bacteroidia bacterium]
MDIKKDIRALSLDELKTVFTENGDQAFRAKQVYEWLWKKSCFSFDEMSNISKELRAKLDEYFVINNVKIHNSQYSADKTIKNSFILHD